MGDDGLWIGPAGGVGWIVTSWRALQAKCSHLDHRPSAGLPIAGVTGTPPQNPDEPDAALRLVTVSRWTLSARPTSLPNFPDIKGFCIPNHEWFFHEAGVHTADGGFSPGIPPNPVGVPHARLWDVHLWLNTATGVPRFGICNNEDPDGRECDGGAVTPANGFVPPVDSFFYPSTLLVRFP